MVRDRAGVADIATQRDLTRVQHLVIYPYLPRMGNGFVCTVSVFGGSSLFVSADITLGHDLTSLALQ